MSRAYSRQLFRTSDKHTPAQFYCIMDIVLPLIPSTLSIVAGMVIVPMIVPMIVQNHALTHIRDHSESNGHMGACCTSQDVVCGALIQCWSIVRASSMYFVVPRFTFWIEWWIQRAQATSWWIRRALESEKLNNDKNVPYQRPD